MIDLGQRPESVLPACAVVTPAAWSDDVADAASVWNERLGWRALGVYPDCPPGSDLVPWGVLPGDQVECGDRGTAYGCTLSKRVDGVPYWREVLVAQGAPFDTLVHEWGHIVGCRHSDLGAPCLWW